jgi:hypothetical protein
MQASTAASTSSPQVLPPAAMSLEAEFASALTPATVTVPSHRLRETGQALNMTDLSISHNMDGSTNDYNTKRQRLQRRCIYPSTSSWSCKTSVSRIDYLFRRSWSEAYFEVIAKKKASFRMSLLNAHPASS